MTTRCLYSIQVNQKFLIAIICLLMNACSWHQSKQEELLNAHQSFYDDYELNLQKFNREINQSLVLRKQSVEFYTQEMLEAENQYFDATDIKKIQKIVAEYKRNRDVLLNDITYRYRKLIENVTLEFSLTKKSELVIHPSQLSKEEKNILYINPGDEKGQKYIKVIKLGLAAALTLYDNFIIAIMPYQENGHFRRNINYDNIENEKIIEEVSGNFRRRNNYKDTLRVVEFNDKVENWKKQNIQISSEHNKDNEYFNVLINRSYTNSRIKEITKMDRLAFRSIRSSRIIRDLLFDEGKGTMNFVSKLFGNSIGLLSSRKGYLKDIPSRHKAKIERQLVAGDILLEKTPFRLTDRFIPGHWGHVAIWVGTEEELKQLGVWQELPGLYAKAQNRFKYKGPSFQQLIRAGHKIVEALRPGVQLNSLEHFLNIDDMAVLRDKSANKTAMKGYILKAFEQIGKDYDFNFDIETDKKIVCSELAFVVYDDYNWPVSKAVGRYTISPDHVAEKANGDGPFVPVMLYHDGKVIEDNIQDNFNHLINAEYEQIRVDLISIQR